MALEAKPKGRITFVTAWSGVGKTTTGDYLSSYCRFHHLDGDDDMRKPHVPECKSATDLLVQAFGDFWFKDRAAPTELWHPYCQLLCDRCLGAAVEYDDIVVSFSVYRREVRDFLRGRLAERGVLFLKLECDVDVVVKGAERRVADYMQLQDKTLEDWWDGPSQFGVCFREKYGEYSFENFKNMQLEYYLAGMEPFAEDERDVITVDVSTRDASVFDRINAALGMSPRTVDVDFGMLHELQTSRWKQLNAWEDAS